MNKLEHIQLLLQTIKNEPIKTKVVSMLPLLEEEISFLFSQLKKCKNIEETNFYFDLLLGLQEVLAELVFKENIIVSTKLRKFIRDCDRLDDSWLREHLFKKIQAGTYTF